MSRSEAAAISHWRYEGPWRIYDLNGQMPGSIDDYYTLRDQRSPTRDIVGFFCVGDDARVPGLQAVDGTVDFGCGMNPALVGQGQGTRFGALVVKEVQRRHADAHCIRAVVQTWNERSIRVLRNLGFTSSRIYSCYQQGRSVQYDILVSDMC